MKKHTCHEIEPFLPATAAGALDPEEHSDIEAHLAECGFCTRKLQEYQETVVELAYAVPQFQPPSHLRSQVLSIVVSQVTVQKGVIERPFEPRASGTPEPALAPTTSRSGSFGSLFGGFYRRLAPAGLALSVLLLVVTGATMLTMVQQMDGMRATVSEAATIKRVLARDGVMRADLQPTNAVATAKDISAQVIMAPGERDVVVVANNLPTPSAGHVYKLWMLKQSGETVPAGDLKVDDNGVSMCSVEVPMDPSSADGLAVSEEAASDSDGKPDGPVVLEAWYK